MAFAYTDPPSSFQFVRGDTVRVRFEGFTPNAPLTLFFDDSSSRRQIGAAAADARGNGMVAGVLPRDAAIGDAQLQVVETDECYATWYIRVLGSEQRVTVDDDTVTLGQLVTVTAGGFYPETVVSAYINGLGAQEDCPGCRFIAHARSSALGYVSMRVRIPRDTSLGAHHMGVLGLDPDGFGDLYMVTDITVSAGSALPRTDTE